jgi:hypothetical protein
LQAGRQGEADAVDEGVLAERARFAVMKKTPALCGQASGRANARGRDHLSDPG